jgi:serine/threonine-protein kinase HipA
MTKTCDTLCAWREGRLIGEFIRGTDGRVSFRYERGTESPISLSLPLDGTIEPEAPIRYLEALLPEDGNQRLAMKVSIGADSTDTFDLLHAVDSAGGLVFLREGEEPAFDPDLTTGIVATEDEIATQLELVRQSCDTWWDFEGSKSRFSLAGSQPKITISRVFGSNFWPDASLPSTHILKPAIQRVRDVPLVEHASMELARAMGYEVPRNEVRAFRGVEAYVIERFDRKTGPNGVARRLVTEDLTQAIGASARDKYDLSLAKIVTRLRTGGIREEDLYLLLSEVAFNAYVGNGDAHAKNYSILLDAPSPSLCPLYDILITTCWGSAFDDSLPFEIGGILRPEELTKGDWAEEGDECGLDGSRVADEAERVASLVREVAPEFLGKLLPERYSRPAIEAIYENTRATCETRQECR